MNKPKLSVRTPISLRANLRCALSQGPTCSAGTFLTYRTRRMPRLSIDPCWFCYANAIGSDSVNKLQVSTQSFGTFGTYHIQDQRMPRQIIAYDHSLNTRGLR